MKQKLNRGFTLIELLVVIAIIGILASVVLASLNTARGKGLVAAYKSEVQQIVPSALLTCDGAAATATHVHSAGSQTNATTVNCADFMNGVASPAVGAQNLTAAECSATVSINGAVFSGTECG